MPLERPRFSTTKLREGYDMGEVDDAIDRIFAALTGDPPTMSPEQVSQLRFTPTRLRDGYDMDEVDQWLDEAAAELEARDGRAGPAVAAPAPSHPSAAATRSDAVVEVQGARARLVPVLVVLAVLLGVAWVVYFGR